MRRLGVLRTSAEPAQSTLSTAEKLRRILVLSAVDNDVTPRLYSPHNGAPIAFRRDGAPAKHLTIVVTRRPISVGGFGLRRLSGYSGEGDRTISGLFDK